MSATEPTVPTIRNAATTAPTPRTLFVNIAVGDVQRSILFFEALGFSFKRQFTDASGTCMLVGKDACFMLLTKDRFTGFSKRPLGDPARETNAIFAMGVGSRAEVDEIVHKAVAAGGSHATDPQDHGFMYGWSFHDPDGHHWEVFWMDPSAMNG